MTTAVVVIVVATAMKEMTAVIVVNVTVEIIVVTMQPKILINLGVAEDKCVFEYKAE
jgi:hypothetical protein